MLTPKIYRETCIDLAHSFAQARTGTITVSPHDAAIDCLTLAHDVHAVLPIPPMDNSAMDGFLVRTADLVGSAPWSFPVAGDVPAGAAPLEVPPGRAVRIMTGAEVIGENVTVIPVEKTNIPAGPTTCPSHIVVHEADAQPRHIRRRGENVQPGQYIATRGQRVDAGTLAAIVSCGVREIEVLPRLRVTVIATGNELGDSDADSLKRAHIPDSNSPMIAQLVHDTGLATVNIVRMCDDIAAFGSAISAAANSSDLIITTGGISAGAFDVVKESLSSHKDSTMWFGAVAMQPGKPQGHGRVGNTMITCLPGNPVSAFVSFQLFVRPALYTLAGLQPPALGYLEADIQGTLPTPRGRDIFVPATVTYVDTWQAQPAAFGSHFIGSLVGVNALIHVPADAHRVAPRVIPLTF
ncbi:molybdopterin molybdotransferase MoeA [Corynebacterium diphtheriae]